MTTAARDTAWGGSGGGAPPAIPPLYSIDDLDLVGDLLVRGGSPWVDARAYGAKFDGSTDDSDALDTAVAACIGSGSAPAVARDAVAHLFLPPGSCKVSRPIAVDSVRGFKVVGAGPWATQFLPAATMDSLFDLNGVYASEIGGFAVRPTLQGATKLTNIFDLYWDNAAAARSTQFVKFHDITTDCAFTTAGFRTAKNGNSPQVDSVEFHRCQVGGGWTGSGTDYQHGYYFGSGGPANALCHWLYGCDFNGTRYGVRSEGVSTHIFGWQQATTDGDATFYLTGNPWTFSASGGRSEGSKRLLDSTGFGAVGSIALRDFEYRAEYLNADGYALNFNAGLHALIENGLAYATGKTPRVNVGGANLVMTVNGLTVGDTGALNNLFNVAATAVVEARGLVRVDNNLVVQERSRGTWHRISGALSMQEIWGTGTPEGAVTAEVGSIFHRGDGGAGTCLYAKESGTGNTGWVAR